MRLAHPRIEFAARVLRAAACVVVLCTVAGAQAAQWVHNAAADAARKIKAEGRLEATQKLHLAISLPLRNQPGLAAFLSQLQDPRSPNFRHYLTPAQFTDRYGPTEKDYQAVIDFATAHGLTVTTKYPNRMIVDVEGPVSKVEQALHVNMRLYKHPREARQFYAPDATPSLDLTTQVLGISGLDNFELPRPRVRINSAGGHVLASPQLASSVSRNTTPAKPNNGTGPSGFYMGNDFLAAYVPGVTLTGSGQTVGLLQFDGYTASDITYYENLTGRPAIPLTNVLLDGFAGTPSGNGNEVEVSLDIEMVISMAQNVSKIIVYEAGPEGNWHDILNRMASDNLAAQLSCSWFIPGGPSDPAADQIFKQMQSQGQSFFSASGDSDAFTGLIPFPGDTPYITEVGGTQLTTNGSGAGYSSEEAWNRNNGVGTGGGISTQYTIPAWQQGINMSANLGSATMRNVPDVALTAESVYVRVDGQDDGVGGTSCAAPLWAGLMALVNQQSAENNTGRIGFINPMVYAIGTGTNYNAAFHDTTSGNNFSTGSPAQFPAVTGYDLCTGLGTPNGRALIDALAPASPVIQTSGTLPATAVGDAYIVALSGTGGAQPYTWTVTDGTFPAGLTLSSTSGLISGSPQQSGTDAFTVQITDLNGFTASASFVIAIYAQGTPVITTTSPLPAGAAGVAYSEAFAATGGTEPYTWAVVAGAVPDGLVLDGSGLLSGTPTATGTFNFSVQVSGSDGLASQSPYVLAVPPAPIINSVATASGTNGAPFSFRVTAANNPTNFTASGLPGGLTMNATTGIISGTPTAIGSSQVSLAASNAYGTGTGSLGIAIAQMPAPVITATLTTLLSFDANDGAFPIAGVLQGSDGNLDGVTYTGGLGYGVLYKMTLGGTVLTTGSFNNTNGAVSVGGLYTGTDGRFYGATAEGGVNGAGAVYRANSNDVISLMASFAAAGSLAQGPEAGLVQATDGNFYGTAVNGTSGDGSIFRMTPSGTLSTVKSFDGSIGAIPTSSLTLASDGYLYGTAQAGGTFQDGAIYRFSPFAPTSSVYNFSGFDGAEPLSELTRGSDGNLYGCTFLGGTSFAGSIFRLGPNGTLTTLYSFSGPDGEEPTGAPIQGNDGNFYGTTFAGGPTGDGVVYMLTPGGTLTVLATFNGTNGSGSQAHLYQTGNGTLYGTTTNGGANGFGEVFSVIPFNVTAVLGKAFSYQVDAASNTTPNPFTAGNLPAGLTFNSSTGIISGTPTALGSNIVPVSATNPAGTGSGTLIISVVSGAPVINSVLGITGSSGKSLIYQITASFLPTRYSASGLPSGLTISTTSGVIHGSTTVSGTTIATISAMNSLGSGTAALAINVLPPAPVVQGISATTGTDGVPFSAQITAIDSPTGYFATGLPAGLSVNPATGVIGGTPTAAGTSAITYGASNASGTSSLSGVIAIDTSFGFWQSQAFSSLQLANSGVSGAMATPLSDGVSNLLKYAFGAVPATPGQAMLPVRSVITVGPNQFLALTYTVNLFAPDVTVTPQVSTDAQTWNSGAGFVIFQTPVVAPNGLTESQTVYDATPISSGSSQQFIRLMVTKP